MSKETIQFMGREVRFEKPMYNFLFNTKWKLDLIKLMSQGPTSIHKLTDLTPVSSRSIIRVIDYLEEQGFRIERTKKQGTPYFQITGFNPEFSELISDLFHIIHQTEQRSCAIISAN